MEGLTEGYVKGVLSGDLIVVSGKLKKGSDEAPEEKNLFLSLVQSPKLNSQSTYEEDPFAWEARLFLRDMLIGKVVKYKIDYKVNDNNFASVFFEKTNVNIEVVKRGYGKVNANKNAENLLKSEFFAKIKNAEAEAQKAKKAIWGDDKSIQKLKITKQDDVDKNSLFKQVKGKPIDAMIEVAFNCTGLLVLLKAPYNCIIKATLRFVAIPNKDTDFYKAGKSYVERLFAHRDLKVVIHHLEDSNFVIDVLDKRVNTKGEEEVKNVALSVLQAGYSKLYISSAFNNDKADVDAAREAQNKAQELGIRSWEGFIKRDAPKQQQQKTNSAGEKVCDFEGVVYSVSSGDSLTIKADDGTLNRIFLSHIKCPALAKANSEEEDKPWSWEAKEYLRRFAVGRRVKAEYDYSKEIKDGRQMNFFSVFKYQEKSEDLVNLGVSILDAGLATYIAPKQNDTNVSKHVNLYADAERAAKYSKKGIHSSKDPGVALYCDLISANPKKKKDFISKNANLGKNVHCVVEHVFSAIRTKLRIDKTKCFIPFKLIGIKCVENDKNNTKQINEFYLKGLDYISNNFLQREGTVDVVHHDKNGNYFGFLTINGINVGSSLIREGHAIIHNPQGTLLPPDYKKAEAEASSKKTGVWSNPGLISILKESDMNNLPIADNVPAIKEIVEKDELVKVRVTDMISLKNFYVNILPNKHLTAIDKVLSKYDEGEKKAVPLDPPIKRGIMCIGYYSQVDQRHYRVRITAALKDEKYEVDFVDYGTIDVLDKNDLFKLDDSISTIEPQVVNAELATIKFSQNSAKKSLALYPNFIDLDKVVNARIAYSYLSYGKPKIGIVIYDDKPNDIQKSVHANLISKGYAKLDSKKPLTKTMQELKEIEKKAKKDNVGMWAENEESDNEDEVPEDI